MSSLALWALAFSALQSAAGPQPAPPPAAAVGHLGVPRIKFEFRFDESVPSHYVIELDQAGALLFSEDEEPTQQVTISSGTKDRAFALAHELGDFDGDYDYRKSRVAFTGSKTFTYITEAKQQSTTVNWSENKAMTEMLAIFQGLGSTLDAGRKLRRMKKYDRLGLNAYLGTLQQQADNGWLRELSTISDVLHDIANDPAIMDMARRRALRLLQTAEKPAAKDK